MCDDLEVGDSRLFLLVHVPTMCIYAQSEVCLLNWLCKWLAFLNVFVSSKFVFQDVPSTGTSSNHYVCVCVGCAFTREGRAAFWPSHCIPSLQQECIVNYAEHV